MPRKFVLNIEHCPPLYGVLADSLGELDTLLSGFGSGARSLNLDSGRPPEPPQIDEPQPVGRPSFDSMIDSAIAELGSALDPASSLSSRALMVLQHLVKTFAPEDLPSGRTVRNRLAERPVGNNSGNKSGKKPRRATVPRNREV